MVKKRVKIDTSIAEGFLTKRIVKPPAPSLGKTTFPPLAISILILNWGSSKVREDSIVSSLKVLKYFCITFLSLFGR